MSQYAVFRAMDNKHRVELLMRIMAKANSMPVVTPDSRYEPFFAALRDAIIEEIHTLFDDFQTIKIFQKKNFNHYWRIELKQPQRNF